MYVKAYGGSSFCPAGCEEQSGCGAETLASRAAPTESGLKWSSDRGVGAPEKGRLCTLQPSAAVTHNALTRAVTERERETEKKREREREREGEREGVLTEVVSLDRSVCLSEEGSACECLHAHMSMFVLHVCMFVC